MSPDASDEISVTPRRDSRVARDLTVIFGCIAGMLLLLATVLVLYPVFAPRERERATPYSCRSNARQLGNALLMYLQDYDNRMPPAAAWSDELYPYTKNTQVFVCPQRPGAPGFAFNRKLDLLPESKILAPAATPTIFESFRDTVNAADPLQSFVAPHAGNGAVVFADGHVQQLPVAPSPTVGLKYGKP